MTTEHPITPPPELLELLRASSERELRLIATAFAAGADQELEACCGWVDDATAPEGAELRAARRRPKPPSLKEQALSLIPEPGGIAMKRTYSPDQLDVIRRALEQLPDQGPSENDYHG